MRLLLLSALLATLSGLTGLLGRLLVLLTGLLLATTTLLTTALAALLVLLILIFIVLAHSILQMFWDLLCECHHSTNALHISHNGAKARDVVKETNHRCRRVPFAQAIGAS
jgi:hypothetical protein